MLENSHEYDWNMIINKKGLILGKLREIINKLKGMEY